MKNNLREAMSKECIIATRIDSTWPMITELVGSTGLYDYIEFLAEYAPFDHYDLENIARAAELHNLNTIVKVDYENRYYVAQKALASGFNGVLFTDHTTKEEVEETLRHVMPSTPMHKGTMGFINRRWIRNANLSSQMKYAEDVSQNVFGFMIEKKEAVDNIEEIVQVEGVDFVQFGPADYSMNCGFDKDDNIEEVKKAEKKVIETALRYNVSPRVEIKHASEAEYYKKLGVKHFAIGTEIRILKDYWKEEGEALTSSLKR